MSRSVRFDVFEFDPQSGELWRAGRLVALPPQPATVLALLVERAGDLVTREAIQERVWPDTTVEFDQGLNSCIRQIRSALGDDAASPCFVQTVPRRGYRFVAPVEVGPHAETERPHSTSHHGMRWVAGGAAAVLVVWLIGSHGGGLPAAVGEETARIAVLPFESGGDFPDDVDLGVALSGELTGRLAELAPKRLIVIGHASSMKFHDSDRPLAEIGERLRVPMLLRGNIARAGTWARIQAELVRSSDGSVVWAGTYESPLEDLGGITVLADRIAREAGAELLTERSLAVADTAALVLPAAREAYLKARYFLRQDSYEQRAKSIPLFEEVLEIHPTYPPAWSGLAEARLRTRDFEGGREAAVRALELDEGQSEAHLVIGWAAIFADLDIERGRHHVERALVLAPGTAEPHSTLAFVLLLQGERSRAVREVERALELDPVSAIVASDVGLVYYWARRYEEALRRCRENAELSEAALHADYCVLHSYLALRRFPEARDQAVRVLEREKADVATIERARAGEARDGLRAFNEWRIDRYEKAAAEHAEHSYAYQLALEHTDLGDRETALEKLEQAFRENDGCVPCLLIEPRLDPLRNDPRFEALTAHLKADPSD